MRNATRIAFILCVAIIGCTRSLLLQDLIDPAEFDHDILEPGDENTQLVILNTPVHFYSEVYDSIYVSLIRLFVGVCFV